MPCMWMNRIICGITIKMKMLRILGNRLGRPEDAGFVCNGDTVPMEMYCFRSARAAFADGGERLFCVEVV